MVFIYSVVRFWSNVPVSEKPGLKFTKLCNHSFLILQTPFDELCNLFHCKIEIGMLRRSLGGEVIFFFAAYYGFLIELNAMFVCLSCSLLPAFPTNVGAWRISALKV